MVLLGILPAWPVAMMPGPQGDPPPAWPEQTRVEVIWESDTSLEGVVLCLVTAGVSVTLPSPLYSGISRKMCPRQVLRGDQVRATEPSEATALCLEATPPLSSCWGLSEAGIPRSRPH